MGSMTVRNLPDAIHDELRQRAHMNGRSLEAEVRTILVHTVLAAHGGGFGDKLRVRFGNYTGDDLSIRRDTEASVPGLFE